MKETSRNERNHVAVFAMCSLVLLTIVSFVALNFGTIKDVLVGMGYQPSSEMESIRESLDLTTKGRLIFNAVRPELQEKEEFNNRCREVENENAILGCYTDDKVYIYNITESELEGIRELTAAHELLHAVYHRMPAEDKQKLSVILMEVYAENQDVLGEEIGIYPEDQRLEELYVREGTEIADLPDSLEKHYAEIFKNQDAVAGYYNGYITVFREIEKKLEELLAKAKSIEAEITNKTTEYEKEAASLNKEVGEFNECAKTPDCFSSNYVFNNRRNELLSKQNALSSMYNAINNLISDYNTVVAEYNENVLHGQALNITINSSTKVEGL